MKAPTKELQGVKFISAVFKRLKNNQTNYFFDGIFGFGEHQGTNQDVQYKVAGTFQIPSGKLEFSGKYGLYRRVVGREGTS